MQGISARSMPQAVNDQYLKMQRLRDDAGRRCSGPNVRLTRALYEFGQLWIVRFQLHG